MFSLFPLPLQFVAVMRSWSSNCRGNACRSGSTWKDYNFGYLAPSIAIFISSLMRIITDTLVVLIVQSLHNLIILSIRD